jgi:hypothetical protein
MLLAESTPITERKTPVDAQDCRSPALGGARVLASANYRVFLPVL